MADDKNFRTTPEGVVPSEPSSSCPTPKGIRRIHKFMKETRLVKRPPLQEFAIHLFSMALILSIMYLDIEAVRNMSKSGDGRTRFFTFLLTLCLPAIIYGVVELFTRRAQLAGLCLKSLLGVSILSLMHFSFEAFEILWFTPTCFAFGFLMLHVKDQWRNRKQGIIVPQVKDREPGAEEDDSPRRSRGFASQRRNSGWSNAYYSFFRIKRN